MGFCSRSSKKGAGSGRSRRVQAAVPEAPIMTAPASCMPGALDYGKKPSSVR
jgi:hypothetical protein